MFSNIYYNNFSNKIHLWEFENGKKRHKKFDYQHKFYIEDEKGDIEDIFGVKYRKKVVDRKKQVKSVHGVSNKLLAESDLNECIKFLHERYTFSEVNYKHENINTMFFDIEVQTFLDEGFPKPENAEQKVNAVAIYYSKTNKLLVLTYDDEREYVKKMNKKDIYKATLGNNKNGKRMYDGIKLDQLIIKQFKDEKQLLRYMMNDIRKEKIDNITGWYSDIFDIPYLVNRMKKLNMNDWKKFSPVGKVTPNWLNKNQYDIAGVNVVDYLKLYQKFTFGNPGSYSLDNVSFIELNKRKLEYDGTIQEIWQKDWDTFINYNIIDTLRVVEIDKQMGFLEILGHMAHESLIPFNKVFSSINDHTGLALRTIHKDGMVLRDKKNNNKNSQYLPGGYVMAKSGLYKYVTSFDIKGMYPHGKMRDNEGIETLIKVNEDDELDEYINIQINGKNIFIPPYKEIDVEYKGNQFKIKAEELLEYEGCSLLV